MQRLIVIVFFMVAVVISGCGKEQNHSITTKDGIKVINNLDQDYSESEKVQLEEIG